MAFPFIFESNFELADASEWDSETDSASQLDFPDYKELARFGAEPYRGRACMRATLSGGTADAFVLEGDIDIAADALRFFTLRLFFSTDFDATADDTFALFEARSGASTPQVTLGARVVSATGAINIGAGLTAPTSFAALALERGVWYTVEIRADLDDGGSNDGSIQVTITKDGDVRPSAPQITVSSLNQAAVESGVLGIQDHLATTTGFILFDGFIFDDVDSPAPFRERFPRELLLTKSGHAFVGPGRIVNASLLSGAAGDNVLRIFDTDEGDAADFSRMRLELKNTVSSEVVDPAGSPELVARGAFVELTGTNPRALIQIDRASGYGSADLVRRMGLKG